MSDSLLHRSIDLALILAECITAVVELSASHEKLVPKTNR